MANTKRTYRLKGGAVTKKLHQKPHRPHAPPAPKRKPLKALTSDPTNADKYRSPVKLVITMGPSGTASVKPKRKSKAKELKVHLALEEDTDDSQDINEKTATTTTKNKKRKVSKALTDQTATQQENLESRDPKPKPKKTVKRKLAVQANQPPEKKEKRESYYGEPFDYPVGMWWYQRMDCSRAGVHRMPVHGIHGGPKGAYSICMSGGYDENEDFGDSFWYCGEGGRELNGTEECPRNLRTAPQTKDMGWSKNNEALLKSAYTKTPVRVIRGFCKKKNVLSPFSPIVGYRYDGLYVVTDWQKIVGKSSFEVLRFKFERVEGQDPIQL